MKTITTVVSLSLVAAAAVAQLSSPLAPAVDPLKAAGQPARSQQAGTAVPSGTGAGIHGANSPFAPLPQRADVVPWSVLTDVKTKTDKNKVLPVFAMGQMALNQKTQRIQGFMMPLEPGEKQKHFLLTSVPLTCGF